jgi:UDP-N-acetylmuramoyl-tripeptide--D-alanyl-D-alanine ligase
MSRTVKRILKPVTQVIKYGLASGYRSILDSFGKVCFICIAGSCGKTTTTELIAAILAKQGPLRKGVHKNNTNSVADTILTVSPKHRFCIQEVGGGAPGLLTKSAKLLRPHISVITNIGPDHYTYYRNLESTALDKGKLVEVLPPGGTAVLNADDPYVLEMRNRTKARVVTYGLSAEAMVRGENVSCAWPQRMSLDVCFEGKRIHIQTKLLGEHWVCSVLAGIAAGIAAGASLQRCIEAAEALKPTPYRMCPHETADGITFISDSWKGAMWTIPFALEFMKKAKARRKIVIIGSIADTPKSFFRRYQAVIRQTIDTVDKIIFAGEHALTALRVKPNLESAENSTKQDNRVMAFDSLYKLHCFLNDYMEAGDLVLLKGVENIDHLQRIILSRTDSAKPENFCWRTDCTRKHFCDNCRHLHDFHGKSGIIMTLKNE